MIRDVNSGLLSPNLIWSIALYSQPKPFNFDVDLGDPIKLLSSKRLRTSVKHIHTQADPFLFVHRDELFLFFESMAINEPGCIAAYKTMDLSKFDYLGVVLKQPFHLSYPMVFESGSSIFMIPESGASNEVALYRFDDFPSGLNKVRVLLTGKYFDSSLVFHENFWYLFTTSSRGLEIFYTDDIEKGQLFPHRRSPIINDLNISRCGGLPLVIDKIMYRIAQNCLNKYGGNLNILRILELTPDNYQEQLITANYFDCNNHWNREGGHHLSVTSFAGRTVVAVDGKHRDYLLNKFISPIFRML